jgi:hypothetical protein
MGQQKFKYVGLLAENLRKLGFPTESSWRNLKKLRKEKSTKMDLAKTDFGDMD